LVRYADDFLLFAHARPVADLLMLRCRGWLARLGLTLHPQKSQVVEAHAPIRFLGRMLRATGSGARAWQVQPCC